MFVGQVTGEIVSTINHPDYDNRRLLVVDRLDRTGKPAGGYLIAVAAIDAGVGDRVLVLDEGTGARQILAQLYSASSLGRRRHRRFGRR